MLSRAGAAAPWLAAVGLLGLLSGCGAQYRPVVTPINPTGPAQQNSNANFVAISTNGPSTNGLATLINGNGDTILAQATLGNGAFSFALNSTGSVGYSLNGNGNTNVTLDAYATSAPTTANSTFGLQTRNVTNSTLTSGSNPTAIFTGTNDLYLLEPYTALSPTATAASNAALAVLTLQTPPSTANTVATAPALQQEIALAPNPVQFAGTPTATRIYAISQSVSGVPLAINACNTPGAVTQTGEAASIETPVNAISAHLGVGVCPTFGIMSGDNNRAFILNRGVDSRVGSSTVTVINVQQNAPDTQFTLNGAAPAVPGTIPIPGGPVHAALYQPSGLLVTANYDANTVTVINVALDIYGNDGPNFGQTHTIPVGNGPVAVTVLQDGSRAYIANQTDGTVSVVDLTSFVVTKTIPVYGGAHPDAISSVSAIGTGKVYVVAKDSQYVTSIRTDTDQVSANIFLQNYGVDIRATTQTAGGPSNSATSNNGQYNSIVNSRAAGQGVPCNPVRDPSPYCPAATQ